MSEANSLRPIHRLQTGGPYSNALLTLFALLMVSSAFGAGLPWHKVGTIKNEIGSYEPVALEGTEVRIYANTNGSMDGDLFLRTGSWTGVGTANAVLHIADPRDTFIRTSGVARGASGTYYAILYTGDGYPTQGGYSPSWATSPDGLAWTWWGPVSPFGRNQSSAASLVVDESRTDGYRFMAWLDINGLYLMHSDTGLAWQSDGAVMWPESLQFVTAAKTPYGYHLMGCAEWPCVHLRHVYSCDGLTNWHVLETASPVLNKSFTKGNNLVYEPATNLLHSVSTGLHFTLAARNFGC